MTRHIIKVILKRRTSTTLLIFEFAIAFITLVSLGVFIINFIGNSNKPLGFKYNNVLQLDFNNLKGEDWDHQKVLIQQFTNLFNSFEEVEAVGFLDRNIPFQPHNFTEILGIKSQYSKIPSVNTSIADNFLVKALSIGVTEGNWFTKADYAMKYLPVVINEKAKTMLFPHVKNVIGKTIYLYKEPATIVGVINDFRYSGDFSNPAPFIFIQSFYNKETTYNQNLNIDANNSDYNCPAVIYLKVKQGAGIDFEERLKNTVSTKLPDWDFRIYRMEKVRNAYIKRVWLPVILVSLVIFFLLVNIVLGLFGVLWYNISLRKSEIGLRLAVGASRANIYRQFIVEMLTLATLGIIPGLIIAAQFPILKVFRIEISVYIISALIAALIIYLLVILCAVLPSAQAAKIQPAVALHEE